MARSARPIAELMREVAEAAGAQERDEAPLERPEAQAGGAQVNGFMVLWLGAGRSRSGCSPRERT